LEPIPSQEEEGDKGFKVRRDPFVLKGKRSLSPISGGKERGPLVMGGKRKSSRVKTRIGASFEERKGCHLTLSRKKSIIAKKRHPRWPWEGDASFVISYHA